MTDLYQLPVGVDPPKRLNAIVEIPRGGQSKYEYDQETGLFRLDRVLYSAVHYPGHYGFVLPDQVDPIARADAVRDSVAFFDRSLRGGATRAAEPGDVG